MMSAETPSMAKKTQEAGPWVHPFERAGFGKAPFKVVGFYEKVYRAHQDAPIQPAGMCEYCGQSIRYVVRVQSSDGHEHEIGTDCVAKTGDTALTEQERKEERAWKYAQREKVTGAERRARQEAEQARLKAQSEQNAQNYEQIIRDAVTILDSPHVPARYREVAKNRLEGLVTGRWDHDYYADEGSEKEKTQFDMGLLIAPLPPPGRFWNVGDKIGPIKVLFEGGPDFRTQFGWQSIDKFRVLEGPEAGAILAWFTSAGFSKGAVGDVFLITATVKEHSEYQGTPQNVITRVKEFQDPETAPVFEVGQRVWRDPWERRNPAVVEAITKTGKLRIRFRMPMGYGNDSRLSWEVVDPYKVGLLEDFTAVRGDYTEKDWADLDRPDFLVGQRVVFRPSKGFGVAKQVSGIVIDVKRDKIKVTHQEEDGNTVTTVEHPNTLEPEDAGKKG